MLILVLLFSICSYSVLAKVGFAHSELKNPEMDPQDGIGWVLLEANTTHTLSIKKEAIAIRQVTFSIDKKTEQGVFSVYHLLTLPDKLPELIGTVYEVEQFQFNSFTYRNLNPFKIKFRIDKTFLLENNLSKYDIALYENKGYGKSFWGKIENITISGEDDNYFHYASTIPPTNFLMITFIKSPSSMVDDTVEISKTEEKPAFVDLDEEAEKENGETAKEEKKIDEPSQVKASMTINENGENVIAPDLDNGFEIIGNEALIVPEQLVLPILEDIVETDPDKEKEEGKENVVDKQDQGSKTWRNIFVILIFAFVIVLIVINSGLFNKVSTKKEFGMFSNKDHSKKTIKTHLDKIKPVMGSAVDKLKKVIKKQHK